MLKIVARPKFTATVVVNTVAIQGSFTAHFIARPTDELEALEKAALANGGGAQDVLLEVCEGFEGVELPDGPLAYTGPESLKKLLTWQGIGPAMSRAYHRALWDEAQGN